MSRIRLAVASVLTLLAIPLIWRDLTSTEVPRSTTSTTVATASAPETTPTSITIDPSWDPKGSSRYGDSSRGTTTTTLVAQGSPSDGGEGSPDSQLDSETNPAIDSETDPELDSETNPAIDSETNPELDSETNPAIDSESSGG